MSDLDPRAPFIHDPSSFPLLTGARARRAFLDERGAPPRGVRHRHDGHCRSFERTSY